MREIKFRIWHKAKKEFHGVSIPLYKIDFFNLEYHDYGVDQFTGLKDKNGKEIFEGDIYKVTHIESKTERISLIDDIRYIFLTNQPLYNTHDVVYADWYEGEVIGNIHENPELL